MGVAIKRETRTELRHHPEIHATFISAARIEDLTENRQIAEASRQLSESEQRLRGAAVEAHRAFDFDFRICLPSGVTRWINCKGAALYGRDGSPQRVFGVNIDITRRKVAEEQLRKLSQAVEQSPESILITGILRKRWPCAPPSWRPPATGPRPQSAPRRPSWPT